MERTGAPHPQTHLERQLRAQERQLAFVRSVVLGIAAAVVVSLADRLPTLPLLVLLAVMALLNVGIVLLIGRFPAREVGIVATAGDMVAVTVAIYLVPTTLDTYLFFGMVILGVAVRFGLVAAVWVSVLVSFMYGAVVLAVAPPEAAVRELLPVRVAYLLGFGVAAGLFARSVIARTLENARLQQRLDAEEREEARRREQEMLSALSREFGSSLEQSATVAAIVRGAAPLLGSVTGLHLLEPGTGLLRLAAVEGDPDLLEPLRARQLERPAKVGAGILGAVAATASSLVADPEARSAPRREVAPEDPVGRGSPLSSMVAVPILSQGGVRAVLWTASPPGRPVGEPERSLAEAVAERAGPALENTSLWMDLQAQMSRMEALQRVVADITSNLAIEEIGDHLVESVAEIFGADRSAIFLRQEEGGYQRAAARNLSDEFCAAAAGRYLGGPGGFAAGLREPLLLTDARSDPRADLLALACRDEGIVSLVVLPLIFGTEPVGTMILGHDRARAWGEAELTLARTLADQAAIAISNATLFSREKRAQRIKDDFLSIVSHELRTPLTSIQGYSQLLEARVRDSGGKAKELAQLEVIRSQVHRMRRLVDDLLDVSRIDRRGGVSVEPHEMDLADELREVAARLARDHPRRRVTLDVPTTLTIEADRDRISQVLGNLVDNGLKYSPGGGPLTLRAQLEDEWVTVSVADEGIGIPTEHLGHVFERFYQADSDVARRRFGGLGLGLYISQAIIDAHGGTIWAEANSDAGRGSVFRFRIPRRAPARHFPPIPGEPPPFVVRGGGAG